jgi:hypothetical protein
MGNAYVDSLSIDTLCSGGNWLGNTSKALLQCYEVVFNTQFPDDYRYFFLNYGSGSKGGVEIAGYDPILTSDNNIITKTILQLRDCYRYPKDFIFFSDTGDGGQICFDKKSWEVLEIYRTTLAKSGFNARVVGKSFFDFLKLKFER